MSPICSNPTAIISKSYERKDSRAPYIAPFSSRGPNRITPNILKVTSWYNIQSIQPIQGHLLIYKLSLDGVA